MNELLCVPQYQQETTTFLLDPHHSIFKAVEESVFGFDVDKIYKKICSKYYTQYIKKYIMKIYEKPFCDEIIFRQLSRFISFDTEQHTFKQRQRIVKGFDYKICKYTTHSITITFNVLRVKKSIVQFIDLKDDDIYSFHRVYSRLKRELFGYFKEISNCVKYLVENETETNNTNEQYFDEWVKRLLA